MVDGRQRKLHDNDLPIGDGNLGYMQIEGKRPRHNSS